MKIKINLGLIFICYCFCNDENNELKGKYTSENFIGNILTSENITNHNLAKREALI